MDIDNDDQAQYNEWIGDLTTPAATVTKARTVPAMSSMYFGAVSLDREYVWVPLRMLSKQVAMFSRKLLRAWGINVPQSDQNDYVEMDEIVHFFDNLENPDDIMKLHTAYAKQGVPVLYRVGVDEARTKLCCTKADSTGYKFIACAASQNANSASGEEFSMDAYDEELEFNDSELMNAIKDGSMVLSVSPKLSITEFRRRFRIATEDYFKVSANSDTYTSNEEEFGSIIFKKAKIAEGYVTVCERLTRQNMRLRIISDQLESIQDRLIEEDDSDQEENDRPVAAASKETLQTQKKQAEARKERLQEEKRMLRNEIFKDKTSFFWSYKISSIVNSAQKCTKSMLLSEFSGLLPTLVPGFGRFEIKQQFTDALACEIKTLIIAQNRNRLDDISENDIKVQTNNNKVCVRLDRDKIQCTGIFCKVCNILKERFKAEYIPEGVWIQTAQTPPDQASKYKLTLACLIDRIRDAKYKALLAEISDKYENVTLSTTTIAFDAAFNGSENIPVATKLEQYGRMPIIGWKKEFETWKLAIFLVRKFLVEHKDASNHLEDLARAATNHDISIGSRYIVPQCFESHGDSCKILAVRTCNQNGISKVQSEVICAQLRAILEGMHIDVYKSSTCTEGEWATVYIQVAANAREKLTGSGDTGQEGADLAKNIERWIQEKIPVDISNIVFTRVREILTEELRGKRLSILYYSDVVVDAIIKNARAFEELLYTGKYAEQVQSTNVNADIYTMSELWESMKNQVGMPDESDGYSEDADDLMQDTSSDLSMSDDLQPDKFVIDQTVMALFDIDKNVMNARDFESTWNVVSFLDSLGDFVIQRETTDASLPFPCLNVYIDNIVPGKSVAITQNCSGWDMTLILFD
eukprot:597861-Hanusia_phi.AAC.1